MDYWYEVKRFKQNQFDVIVDWTYEHAALGDCFDETVTDLESMIDRCNRGIDTHYIARVRVMYDGHEMGSATLGSCYAYGCDPEDDINAGISGYLEDMIYEAMDDARTEAVKMLDRLKRDFLGVDNVVG
jgi:hypothetical protein